MTPLLSSCASVNLPFSVQSSQRISFTEKHTSAFVTQVMSSPLPQSFRAFRPSGVNFCLFLALSLLCSCSTPYRPMKNGAGYSDQQAATNEFRVAFQGDGNTSLEKVYDFAMLRAAEVTRQHGFSHFAVIGADNTSSVQKYKIPEHFQPDLSTDPRYPITPTLYTSPGQYPNAVLSQDPRGTVRVPEQTRLYCEPGTSLLIRCFAGKPAKPFTYDAAELEQALRTKNHL